jgi:hypothetical protein
MLPNLPSELDIVLLRPSDRVLETHSGYRPQFRAAFRVRRGHIITWLRYLQANHPDYRYITISLARINALPDDADLTSSFPSIIDETVVPEDRLDTIALAPPPTQSMVPDLNINATEAALILGEISSRPPLPPGLPAPSIRATPLDEAARKERLFAMAFPTLYPTGCGDYNAPRIRQVTLIKYA